MDQATSEGRSGSRPMKVGQMIDVFARDRTGHHVIKTMKWGLVPSHFHGFPDEWHGNTSHARVETVDELPSFREAWNKKWRVIFAMDHYSQKTTGMQDLFGGDSREVKVNIARSDGQPMAVAGIYSAIKRPSGLFLSCAMLTRPASPGLEEINERFPLVIERDQMCAWLDRSDDLDLLTPPPADRFVVTLAD